MLYERSSLKALHDSHSLHGSISAEGFRQLMVLAKMRAQVVFPTPRGPQNKYACARCLFTMAFFNVVVIDDCPTTLSNVIGRYFRADTINSPISVIQIGKYRKTYICQVGKFSTIRKRCRMLPRRGTSRKCTAATNCLVAFSAKAI